MKHLKSLQTCLILLSNAFDELMTVKSGKTSSLSCDVHPGHVVHGSEQSDLVIHTSVSFHALKQLLSVVEHLGRRMDLHFPKRFDRGSAPTLVQFPFDPQPVVCESFAEAKILHIGLLVQLGRSAWRNFQTRAENEDMKPLFFFHARTITAIIHLKRSYLLRIDY